MKVHVLLTISDDSVLSGERERIIYHRATKEPLEIESHGDHPQTALNAVNALKKVLEDYIESGMRVEGGVQ